MKRPLMTITAFSSLHLLVLTVAAQMPASMACPECYELKTQIEANYFSHDEASVRCLLARSRDLIDRHPAAWHPHYYAGLICIQLGNIARHDDKAMAYRHFTDALAHMIVAHERSPTAECAIVLADVYGKLASLKTFKMLYYGSRSKSYLIDAFRKARSRLSCVRYSWLCTSKKCRFTYALVATYGKGDRASWS